MFLKNFITIVILIFPTLINQRVLAQEEWVCETVAPDVDILTKLGITSYQPTIDSVTINIYVHVIFRSDSTGGLTDQQIENSLCVMKGDFMVGNIYFYKM
ncbi:MAG: hypothetical protein H0Z29_09730 [Candidatus Marinimicrobia bacterium]|nr:hypothetical protein [Candidatus Neomarinimicrobiota bacterium]